MKERKKERQTERRKERQTETNKQTNKIEKNEIVKVIVYTIVTDECFK